MARVVVDELVVALRLDDSQFDAAVAEAIAARQKLADETGRAEQRESSALAGMARRYLSLYAVLSLVSSAYKEMLQVSDGLLQLSNESRRLGMAAHGLRTWQNAFEMLGGSAGDATSEIDKFTNSLNNLIFKGDVGENLQWLNRLGITPQRGMTYENTAPRVFSGIKEGLASGAIKSAQEAGYLARQAGFGGVAEYITQNPSAGAADFQRFLGAAESRAVGTGTANAGAAVGRNTIRNAQELLLTKEGVAGRQAGRIMEATNTATAMNKLLWKGGENLVDIAAETVNVVGKVVVPKVENEKSGVGFVSTFSGGMYYDLKTGKALTFEEAQARNKGLESYSKVSPITSAAPPTPNVMGGSSSSKTVTINQTNNIRSTDPVAAGNAVADKTRKAVNAQADGAAR